jgi:hypothetical protein
MQNQKLAAQGQQRMEQLQGAGEQIQMNMQENRDLRDINRLQVSADMAQQQRTSGVSTAALSLGSSLAGLSGLAYKPEANLNDSNSSANLNASADPNAQSFRESLNEGANAASRQNMNNIKLEEVPDSPEFDFGNIYQNMDEEVPDSPEFDFGNIYQNMGLNSTRNPDKYAYSQPLSIGNPSYED